MESDTLYEDLVVKLLWNLSEAFMDNLHISLTNKIFIKSTRGGDSHFRLVGALFGL